jgi:hypothetical protein
MIQSKNEFGALTKVELEDFEKANETSLPTSYKQFLLDSNGGQLKPNRNKIPDTIVSYLFGMHNGEYYASLYKRIEMFKGRLPYSTFPIAVDPFGNLFIMSLHEENYGQVYFWDHEMGAELQGGNYTDNCTFVAYSFQEFLNNLVE